MKSVAYILLITIFVYPFYFYKLYMLENTDTDSEIKYLLAQPNIIDEQFDNSVNKRTIYDIDIQNRDNKDLAEFDSSFKNFINEHNTDRQIVKI